jgi:SAM-dependent methyltransferase
VADRPAVAFDRIAVDTYDRTRGGDERGARLTRDLRRWLRSGPVLEVGVGTGVLAAALVEAGVPMFGVDLALPMLGRAYTRLGPRVAAGDARRLPIADDRVDNLVYCWVLHLVGDLPRTFAEAGRVLRPAGRVVCVHGPPVCEPSDLDAATASLDPVRLRRPDTVDGLREAAVRAGLRPVHVGWTTASAVAVAPEVMARDLEARIWSYLWSLDDTAWADHVAPAIAALRALPEPERTRRFSHHHRLSVFAAPGEA